MSTENTYINNGIQPQGHYPYDVPHANVQPSESPNFGNAPAHTPYDPSHVEDEKPVNCDKVMNVTSITDLTAYAKGQIVRFPDFAEGQPFVARVRRPSMLVLAKTGKIPNALMHSAGKLFSDGGSGLDSDDEKMLSNLFDVTEVICKAALIEPTYDEIKNAGLELSDDQLMAIFNYTQTGVKALESFR